MEKNVASQKIQLFAFDATTNVPKTGDAANITAYVSKDHGAVTVLGDTSATEMDATNAPGVYVFDLAQSETNANDLTFSAKSSTANIKIVPRFVTTTAPNSALQSIDSNGRVDVIKLAGTTQTARDIGASVLLSNGTGTGQLKLASGYVAMTWADIASPTTTVNLSGTTIKTATDVATQATTIAGYLDTEIAAILADTNELQTDWADGGRLDLILDARASQTSVDTVDGIVDSILVDTNELQTDWANNGRLDLILDARASQSSVDTVDGIVDSILVDTAEIGVAGAGLTALASAANLATAQTSINDIPTNSELATALAAADDAVLAAIAALNDLSAAEVNAEVLDVLNVDTFAYPGQGNPPATTTLRNQLGYLYKNWRNRKTQTATEFALYADDGTTKDQEAVVSDDGTTTTFGEMATGA